jgi:ribosomal-protein-alanine N-acetyltransferase
MESGHRLFLPCAPPRDNMENPSSPRLLYRRLRPEDVSEEYVAWLNDPEINGYLEIRFAQQTIEKCRDFVERMNADRGQHLFGMFDKENNCHIGNIKLGFINLHHRKGQISFFIGNKAYHRKGLATEAIGAVTRWGFERCGLEKIEACCYDNNVASLRSFLRCRYSVEGYLRSSVISAGQRMGSFLVGITSEDVRLCE